MSGLAENRLLPLLDGVSGLSSPPSEEEDSLFSWGMASVTFLSIKLLANGGKSPFLATAIRCCPRPPIPISPSNCSNFTWQFFRLNSARRRSLWAASF